MSYIRNPRLPHIWESDGDWDGKFKGANGIVHDSANDADKYDLERNQHPWWPRSERPSNHTSVQRAVTGEE